MDSTDSRNHRQPNNRLPGYLLAAIVLALASGARADDSESTNRSRPPLDPLQPPLTLIWYDSHGLVRFHLDTMTTEVERIFNHAGMSLNWELGADARHDVVDRDPLRINLVLLPSPAQSWGLPDSAMGVTTRDETHKGSIYIFFPQVLRALGYIKRAERFYSPKISRDVALAIGRVISHEIVHYLAPHHPHSKRGLMCPKLNRGDLISKHVHLDPASVRVVRRELAVKANVARAMTSQ